MLLKTTNDVFVPAVPAQDYRPYSKTCPGGSPVPPQGASKTVCGTLSVYVFVAFDTAAKPINVAETIIQLPGLPPTVSWSSSWDTDLSTSLPLLVSSMPYCATIQVYE
jgi:hypothetical protein